MGHKSYRSWMYIFYWLMNAAIVNSYILFKDASTAPRQKKYGQIDFWHELAIGLINNYMGRQLNPQTAPLCCSKILVVKFC